MIKSLSLTIVLAALFTLFCVNCSYAQFGNTFNRIKSNVKSDVNSQNRNNTRETKNNVNLETKNDVQSNEKQTSEETRVDVQNGNPNALDFTKSLDEIKATYLKLNPEVYYLPYENYRFFYYDENNNNKKGFLSEIHTHIMRPVKANLRFSLEPLFLKVKFGDKEYSVPVDDLSTHAYFALFQADPAGYVPYCNFMLGIAYKNAYYDWVKFSDPHSKVYPTNDSNNPLLLRYKESDRRMKWNGEQGRLYEIMKKQTPVNVILKASQTWLAELKKKEAAGDYAECLRLYVELEPMMKALASVKHLKTAAPFEDEIAIAEHTWKNNFDNLTTNKFDKWKMNLPVTGKPVAMPKTYNMGAPLATKALAAAKKQFSNSFKVDKVFFVGNKWRIYKDTKWPYHVKHRSISVILLTKTSNGWVMRDFNMQEHGNGTKWTGVIQFTAPFGGGNPKPVNYKP